MSRDIWVCGRDLIVTIDAIASKMILGSPYYLALY